MSVLKSQTLFIEISAFTGLEYSAGALWKNVSVYLSPFKIRHIVTPGGLTENVLDEENYFTKFLHCMCTDQPFPALFSRLICTYFTIFPPSKVREELN